MSGEIQRGNQVVVIGGSDFKAAKDAKVFQSVLGLPHQKAPNKYTVPATHYKLVLTSADELRTTTARMMSTRAANDHYQHVQMRADTDRNTLYLWHDTTRSKRERNPNKPFAGEDESIDAS